MAWPQYFCIQQAQCTMQGLLQRASVKEKVLPLNPIVHSLGAACIDAAVAWVHDRASHRCLADQVPADYWQTSSVEFSSRRYLCAREGPYLYTLSIQSLRSFASTAFKTAPMFVWLMTALSRQVLPVSTPLSSRWSMVWFLWLCAWCR